MLTATTHHNVYKVKTSTNTGSELTHEFQIMAIASKFTETSIQCPNIHYLQKCQTTAMQDLAVVKTDLKMINSSMETNKWQFWHSALNYHMLVIKQ